MSEATASGLDAHSHKENYGVWDKNGYPIRPGDVLKVFHFVGSRNRKHYMYKLAWVYTLADGRELLMASHLSQEVIREGCTSANSYRITMGHLGGTEIVQGYACIGDELSFEDRERNP